MMNIKLLGLTVLGAVTLLTLPVISNVSQSSHSGQRYANISRVDQNDAKVSMTRSQEWDDPNFEEEALEIAEPEIGERFERSPQSTVIAGSYSVQESAISLGVSELKNPYTLTIRPKGGAAALKGTIQLNGKTLKSFSQGTTQINLSPYLRKGRHTINVLGSYRPAGASVEIVFEGPAAEMVQETGGSGVVEQTIVVDVQPD